jgi:hypothetical protein
MFATLNASGYRYGSDYCNAEFEYILSGIITCYKYMKIQNVEVVNNENSIRDTILHNYLKKERYKSKFGLNNYLFDSEVPENTGRVDIRIMPINPFVCDDAYYIIECKRLDANNQNGVSGLNAEYISNGICRFVSEKYFSYYHTNGMIGFIIQPMDIQSNTESINSLLLDKRFDTHTTQNLQFKKLTKGFAYSYCSIHRVANRDIVLYHLMLDFSDNCV